MKKHLSCPGLLAYIILAPLIGSSFCLFFALCASGGDLVMLIPFSVMFSFFFLILFFIYRKLFCVVKISPEGISNKHIMIPWEETKNYRIMKLKIGWHPTLFRTDILCVGEMTQTDTALSLNPEKQVFISLDKKTIKEIQSFAGKNSPV